MSDNNQFSIQVKLGDQKSRRVHIGSVVMLGAVYRLAVPASQLKSK